MAIYFQLMVCRLPKLELQNTFIFTLFLLTYIRFHLKCKIYYFLTKNFQFLAKYMHKPQLGLLCKKCSSLASNRIGK